MTHRKRVNRILTVLCVLSVMFSMLGNVTVAFAASEMEREETTAAPAEDAEKKAASEDSGDKEKKADEGSGKPSDQESTEQNDSVVGETAEEKTGEKEQDAPADGETPKKPAEEEKTEIPAADETSEQTTKETESNEESNEEVSPEKTDTSDNIGNTSEKSAEETKAREWNAKPITGESESNGISASVSAPKGSFPEGTTVHIKALSKNEAAEKADKVSKGAEAVAFDITFQNADGKRVQPDNGKNVSVSFSIPTGSLMNSGENEKATLKVYHLSDNGTAELMTSSPAPDAASSANISVEADRFSVYMLLKESAETPQILRAPALRAVQNDVITKIEARTYDGSGPQGDTGQWDVFRLNADFALPNGQVHAGDTTVITLPEKLKFNQTANFEIKDKDGRVVANAVINGGAKTLTLTYTDYVDTNSDITGSFYFYVQIDRDKVDGEEVIPIEIDVSGKTIIGDPIHFVGIPDPTGHYLAKSGWQATQVSDRAIRYQLSVNTAHEAIRNVTITDKIATAGFTILRDSITIRKGTWESVHGDWQLQNDTDVTSDYSVTWNDDGSFTIDLGDIEAADGFAIRYTAEASYDLVDGEVVSNDAVIKGDNIKPHTASAHAYYYVAGGTAEGYVFTINIHKTDESGEPLAGAVFNVVRAANDAVVGTITTDASGRGGLSGLLRDAYRIVEVSAPTGYTLLEDPVEVSPDEFGSDKAVLKEITNKKNTISINVCKTWDDADNQDGIRPRSVTVKLLADDEDTGKTVELNADNNWTAAFTDLEEYQNGQKITYRVEEVDPAGYTSTIDGDADTGYTITNTHTPETTEISGSKTWDDNDDQDGVRPESITIRLLADGAEIDSVTVGEADGWSWNFSNLPKYKDQGTEIVYSITEDAVSDYTPEYNDYDVTNRHTPGKTSVTVSKVWDDQNNKSGDRPESITIRLLADGKDTGKTLTLDANKKWKGSFTGLDRYQDGKEIVYTITEDSVSGYTISIKGNAGTGFTVTNSKTTKTTTTKKPTTTKKTTAKKTRTTKNGSPGTGDNSGILVLLCMMLLSGGAIVLLLLWRRKRNK